MHKRLSSDVKRLRVDITKIQLHHNGEIQLHHNHNHENTITSQLHHNDHNVETACSFATESKNERILTKAAEEYPSVVSLSDNSHSARLVLKYVQKQIRTISIHGNKSVVSSCKAILEVNGSVDELILREANQLSMLPNDVIDRLLLKINERVEMWRLLPPSDEIAYNEKLDYLRNVANSQGRPKIKEVRSPSDIIK